MNAEVLHHYRYFRGNLERTAESAYQSARAHIYFLKRLGEMVNNGKKRRLRRSERSR